MFLLGVETFYFLISAGDSAMTTDVDPPIEYQINFTDACLTNSILPLATVPKIIYT